MLKDNLVDILRTSWWSFVGSFLQQSFSERFHGCFFFLICCEAAKVEQWAVRAISNIIICHGQGLWQHIVAPESKRHWTVLGREHSPVSHHWRWWISPRNIYLAVLCCHVIMEQLDYFDEHFGQSSFARITHSASMLTVSNDFVRSIKSEYL